ncbi:MAG TPA: hypothetical protein VJJ28_01575 [Candidatus Paceibacterota bacterium]
MKFIKEITRNPHIDWIIVLLLSVIITAILAIKALYLYNAVISGNIQEISKTSSNSQGFNEKSISSVLELFSQREEMSKKAKVGYSGVGDPSI